MEIDLKSKCAVTSCPCRQIVFLQEAGDVNKYIYLYIHTLIGGFEMHAAVLRENAEVHYDNMIRSRKHYNVFQSLFCC